MATVPLQSFKSAREQIWCDFVLAIILEGHAATLARFANLVKECEKVKTADDTIRYDQYSFLTRLAVEG